MDTEQRHIKAHKSYLAYSCAEVISGSVSMPLDTTTWDDYIRKSRHGCHALKSPKSELIIDKLNQLASYLGGGRLSFFRKDKNFTLFYKFKFGTIQKVTLERKRIGDTSASWEELDETIHFKLMHDAVLGWYCWQVNNCKIQPSDACIYRFKISTNLVSLQTDDYWFLLCGGKYEKDIDHYIHTLHQSDRLHIQIKNSKKRSVEDLESSSGQKKQKLDPTTPKVENSSINTFVDDLRARGDDTADVIHQNLAAETSIGTFSPCLSTPLDEDEIFEFGSSNDVLDEDNYSAELFENSPCAMELTTVDVNEECAENNFDMTTMGSSCVTELFPFIIGANDCNEALRHQQLMENFSNKQESSLFHFNMVEHYEDIGQFLDSRLGDRFVIC